MSPNFQFSQQGESCHHQLGWRTWEGSPGSDLGEGKNEGCRGGARDRAGKGVLGGGRGDRVKAEMVTSTPRKSMCTLPPPYASLHLQ